MNQIFIDVFQRHRRINPDDIRQILFCQPAVLVQPPPKLLQVLLRKRQTGCHGMTAKPGEQIPAFLELFKHMISFYRTPGSLVAVLHFRQHDHRAVIMLLQLSGDNPHQALMTVIQDNDQHTIVL